MKNFLKAIIALTILLSLSPVLASNQEIDVTFHKNLDGETDTYTHKVTVGDQGTGRIPGFHEYGGAPTTGSQHRAFFTSSSSTGQFKRGISWNTNADGSGYNFRGGQIVTEEMYQILQNNGGNLYQVWASVFEVSGSFSAPTPVVTLNGSSNHDTIPSTLVLNPSDNLNVKASLTQSELQAKIVWGRLDKWGDHGKTAEEATTAGIHGYFTVFIESAIELIPNKEFNIVFDSPWLMIDTSNVIVDEQAGRSTAIFNTNDFTRDANINSLKIPVKMMNKSILAQKSFSEFSEDMSFSLLSNESILNYFDRAQFDDVVTETKLTRFYGSIDLTIDLKDPKPFGGNTQVLPTVTSSKQNVRFRNTEMMNVDVHHYDLNGDKIAESTQLQGLIGEDYEASSLNLEKYEYAYHTGDLTGKFSLKPQEVSFYYRQIKSHVIVSYLDEDGNEIAPQDVYLGNIGSTYEVESKEIEGYTLISDQSIQAGVYTEKDTEIVFNYEKSDLGSIITPPDKEENNGSSPKDDIGNAGIKETLPKTGSVSLLPYAVILTLMGTLIFIKSRKIKD